jgi:salicylate hydroxylase
VPVSRVTLVGDAAHTHGGAFAAGGSLALDDSHALGLAFKHVFASSGSPVSQENIQQALNLYDQTRRPHTARLLSIVHGSINRKAPTFATPEEEDEALRTRMRSRPDLLWLSEHDVEQAFKQVVIESGQRNSEAQNTTTQPYAANGVASPAFDSKL